MVVELLFFLYFTYFVSVFFFCGIQFRLCMLITPMNGVCECVSVSINIVIYHLLNAFKQQRAGKHFAKSKSKEMVTFNSTHTHISFHMVDDGVFFFFFSSCTIVCLCVWPGFSVAAVSFNVQIEKLIKERKFL